MPTADPFAEVLAEAYAAFATPPPAHLNVCTDCCMSPAAHNAMLAATPKDISTQQLSAWMHAAFINREFPDRVCTFLAPRLMQAAVQDLDNVEQELLFDRVHLGNPDRWTDAQNAVIAEFHRLYIQWFAKHLDAPIFLDDVLCMFSLGRFPVAKTLSHLSQWSDADLINRLWQDCYHSGAPKLWQSVWWDWGHNVGGTDCRAERTQVENWITGPDLRARLDAFLERTPPADPIYARAAELEVALVRGF